MKSLEMDNGGGPFRAPGFIILKSIFRTSDNLYSDYNRIWPLRDSTGRRTKTRAWEKHVSRRISRWTSNGHPRWKASYLTSTFPGFKAINRRLGDFNTPDTVNDKLIGFETHEVFFLALKKPPTSVRIEPVGGESWYSTRQTHAPLKWTKKQRITSEDLFHHEFSKLVILQQKFSNN